MLTKDGLKRTFGQDWKKQYQVALFKEKGFQRRACACGNYFWTLDPSRATCGSPPCENYGFLEKPITRKKLDYVGMWREFEKFFVKEGHSSIPRYPVVDRWRPDLYFTIASIQDFQRIDRGQMVFEYPANPLIVPQVCLRFPDIQNVGVTGRHNTSFIMPGQHAFGFPKEGYFKDRCLDLNFRFLHGVMGIPEKELTYIEDVWAMPDFSAFGPSIECLSRGLELVNHVFMEFTRAGEGFRELETRVNDTGWGHERLVWFSNGGLTSYETVFGPVVAWMKKEAGLKETGLFREYASLAAGLDVEDRGRARALAGIAKALGVRVEEVGKEVLPFQGVYAIADHLKTLLFAVTDGAFPSNVGGGYNLRVILRRALGFMKECGFSFDLAKIAELHARHLRPLFPELKEGLKLLPDILAAEQERYEKTAERALALVRKELERGIGEEQLTTLYISHGVTPEAVQKFAVEQGKRVDVPEDFYRKVTERHMAGRKAEEHALEVDVSSLPATDLLYYQDPYRKEMESRVLASFPGKGGAWIALDRTVFYPEGGGQPPDQGWLEWAGGKARVADVQKVGGVVLHKVDKAPGKGVQVHGRIDWERREILMKMHDATHIVAGACRKVLGPSSWQAGAQKGVRSSRLDVTHYRSFTEEELGRIEKEANDAVKKNLEIRSSFLPRGVAEGRFGFVIYQGGASPGATVRVVEIPGLDVEACGGTHGHATGSVESITIIRSERVQDGVNRLEFACSGPAREHEQEMEALRRGVERALKGRGIPMAGGSLRSLAAVFSVELRQLPRTVERFLSEVDPGQVRGKDLGELGESLFSAWKAGRREQEQSARERARATAQALAKRVRDGKVFDIVSGERKDLIQIARELLELRPEATVILANQAGDLVGMSRTRDMGKEIRELCKKAGGAGGGQAGFGQGKVQISKLLRMMEKL